MLFELAVPLSNCCLLQSLESGIIPDCFKRAAIVPIYKSGDKLLPSNYSPISLTPILMKIFERVIRKQVTQFLTLIQVSMASEKGDHVCLLFLVCMMT